MISMNFGSERPLYGCPWLNGCVNVLSKPGSPLDEVIEKITIELASKLETDFRNVKDDKRRQITYSLLGFPYVSKHFPNSDYNLDLLECLSSQEKNSLLEEAKARIGAHLERIIEKQNYGKPLTEYSSVTPLGNFVTQSRTIFEDGVDREIRDAAKSKAKQTSREKVLKFDNSPQNEDDNVMWDKEIDIVGQALVEVCHAEPQRSKHLFRIFRDKNYSLPSPLRILLLKEFLFTREKDKNGLGLADVEDSWRSQFIKVVRRHSADLVVDSAIRSSLSNQIEAAVKETYDRVAGLRFQNTDDQQKEAARVLNVLQVYNKLFDPVLVLWLFPVQLTFSYSIQGISNDTHGIKVRDKNGKSTSLVSTPEDAHSMELAMFLDLITRHCIPTPERIFKMADEVIRIWREWDSSLYASVQKALKKDILINAKDFPAQTLHVNRSKANKLFVKLKGKSRNDIPKESLGILTDPTAFVRKWIAEGFASAVNHDALLFIWDQLSYHEWSERTFVNVSLALLFLLKPRFVKAKDYFGVREIFVSDPSRLYSADIRKAILHVQNGNNFNDIPNMNRNTPKSEDERVSSSEDLHGR